MDTSKLKKFAQFASDTLGKQVAAKLELVLSEGSAARRESAAAVKKLEAAIKDHGKAWVTERVAYIWFNRFCALRFMDVNGYLLRRCPAGCRRPHGSGLNRLLRVSSRLAAPVVQLQPRAPWPVFGCCW